MKVSSSLPIFVALLAAAAPAVQAAPIAALDNTAGGTATLATSLGSLTTQRWNFKVFTVGASDATISSMVMGLWSSEQTTYNLTWDLYNVDVDNNPTGTVLATDTQSQDFLTTGGENASYYTFTTGGTLGSYEMTAGETFGLLFRSNAISSSLSWTEPSSGSIYSPGSSGFTFVANRRTTNSGSSYSDNGYYNAWQMNIGSGGTVPEPSALALLLSGAGLLGGTVLRRKKAS